VTVAALDGSVTRDQYTDIFSFGSTMYQVLAWKTTLDIDTGPPARPEGRLGQEWDAIWKLILRCVSKEHDDRPSAVELVASLKAI